MDLLRLNDYCLDHIFSYLNSIDVINVWRTSDRFNYAIKRCIRRKIVDLTNVIRQIPCDNVKQYLNDYGREIRRLSLNELSVIEQQIDFEFLLVHCPDLEEIQIVICSTDTIDRSMLLRFLGIHSKLKLFKISGDLEDVMNVLKTVTSRCTNLEEIGIKIHPADLSEITADPTQENLSNSIFDRLKLLRILKIDRYPGNNISKEIAKLKDLTVLHMTTCQVTGRHLNSLKKLQELNLHGCYRLHFQHLIEILKANIDITKLNVAYCCIQFRALTGTAATQKNLEWLEMNSCFYDCFIVQQLRNLRHLRIFEVDRSVSRLERFLKQLSHFHRNYIQTLEIYNRSQILDVNDCMEILSFKKLKKLTLRGFKNLNDDFLRRTSISCSQLEILDLWDSGASLTENGVLDLIRNSKNLLHMKISNFDHFNEALYNQIVQIRTVDVKHKFPLMVYLPNSDLLDGILLSKEYTETERFVRLIGSPDILLDFF